LLQTIKDRQAEVHRLKLEQAMNSEDFNLDSELMLKSKQILKLENDLQTAQSTSDALRRELGKSQFELERKDKAAQKLKLKNDRNQEVEGLLTTMKTSGNDNYSNECSASGGRPTPRRAI
jgi:predicted RNase H-like nuclease (RuvC/YqgF family)